MISSPFLALVSNLLSKSVVMLVYAEMTEGAELTLLSPDDVRQCAVDFQSTRSPHIPRGIDSMTSSPRCMFVLRLVFLRSIRHSKNS